MAIPTPTVDADAADPRQLLQDYLVNAFRLGSVLSDLPALAQHQLTAHEWASLRCIKAAAPVTVSVLARQTFVSRQRLSRTLRLLTKLQLIEVREAPGEKPSKLISPTAKGEAVLAAVSESLDHAASTLLDERTARSLAKALRVNHRLTIGIKSSVRTETTPGKAP